MNIFHRGKWRWGGKAKWIFAILQFYRILKWHAILWWSSVMIKQNSRCRLDDYALPNMETTASPHPQMRWSQLEKRQIFRVLLGWLGQPLWSGLWTEVSTGLQSWKVSSSDHYGRVQTSKPLRYILIHDGSNSVIIQSVYKPLIC